MKAPIPIHLAVEDDLSEGLVRRLLEDRAPPFGYAVGTVFKKGGFGYLKKRSAAFNNMAKACPVLMLTDLDQCPCPPRLLKEWLPHPKHRDFLLRVAVREVEAWLLASDDSMCRFLRLRRDCRVSEPEGLRDPKAELLRLAWNSPNRDLRDGLVRRDRSGNLRQGPAYNSMLAPYVHRLWEPDIAVTKCASLERMLKALAAFEADWRGRLP